MSKNKIRLGDKKKALIKKNFDKIKPSKLSVNELNYYNKVKAGKARQKTAFKDKDGKFSVVPQKIIDQYVRPVVKALNPDYTEADLKKHIKENKELLKKITNKEAIGAFYNNGNIEKALLNTNELTKFYIDDGNGLVKYSRDKLLELFKKYETKIFSAGGFGFFTKVTFKNGFEKMVVYLPDFEDLEELDDDDNMTVIKSDPEEVKRLKNEAKKNKNR